MVNTVVQLALLPALMALAFAPILHNSSRDLRQIHMLGAEKGLGREGS